MWLIRGALSVCLFVVVCSGHTSHLGRTCPDVSAFPNLSIDKILGVWYVVYQFDTANTCLVWNITKSPNQPETLKVTESRHLSFLDAVGIEHKHSVTGTVDIPNPEVPSKMRIRWPTSLTGKADFIVFDTDYQNYLVFFECNRAGIFHRRDVTVLSKTKNIDKMFIDRVKRLLDAAQVGYSYLQKINHEACYNTSSNNWHIEGELYGLLPSSDKNDQIKELSRDVKDYDISEIEIIGEGISPMSESFRGSLQKPTHL